MKVHSYEKIKKKKTINLIHFNHNCNSFIHISFKREKNPLNPDVVPTLKKIHCIDNEETKEIATAPSWFRPFVVVGRH